MDGQNIVVRCRHEQLEIVPVQKALVLRKNRHDIIAQQYFFHDYSFFGHSVSP
jgi:hypothetical protein